MMDHEFQAHSMTVISRLAAALRTRVRFDRNELSGAFGDIGTDLPLIIGMLLASNLDTSGVLVAFGVMHILTALAYGIPMPVQPLKAVAALVIAQHIPASVITGGGIAIGVVMLLLTVTGLLDWIGRVIPLVVVRGIQLGLGLQLANVALTRYVPAAGMEGYVLACVAFFSMIAFLGNRRFPPALPVIGAGFIYILLFHNGASMAGTAIGFNAPLIAPPDLSDLWPGFVTLALPQIPLSIGNSLLATQRITTDLFPERRLSLKKLGFTYSAMNLLVPFLGGVPVCHGSGGMAGHYLFGGRTGGSVFIYGTMYLLLGLFFAAGFSQFVQMFPLPLLGVILLFESIALIRLIRDVASSPTDMVITIIVGLLSFALPSGYLVGMLAGMMLILLRDRISFKF
jgi:hypothetical protein